MVKLLSRLSFLVVAALIMAAVSLPLSSGPALATAAVDPFSGYVGTPGASGTDAAAVTPSDSVDLTTVSKFIGCTVAGNINLITKAGTTVVIACAVGEVIPLVATRIKATSTTATGIWVITN